MEEKILAEGKWGTDLASFLVWAMIKKQIIDDKTSEKVIFYLSPERAWQV